MGPEILVPLGLFACLTAVFVVPNILKYRDRAKMHDTLRAAFERGQPVPPEMIDALQRDVRKVDTPTADLRRGIILIFVALGLAAMGFIFGQFADEARWAFTAFAAIPGFIGLGYLALYLFVRGGKTS